jgi:hypothetical protein
MWFLHAETDLVSREAVIVATSQPSPGCLLVFLSWFINSENRFPNLEMLTGKLIDIN